MFATCFYGLLNTRTGELRLLQCRPQSAVRAPRLRRAWSRSNWPAAFRSDSSTARPYTGGSVKLAPGDALFLYTDGVSEATNDALDDFTDERLAEVLRCRLHLVVPRHGEPRDSRSFGLHRGRAAIRRHHDALHSTSLGRNHNGERCYAPRFQSIFGRGLRIDGLGCGASGCRGRDPRYSRRQARAIRSLHFLAENQSQRRAELDECSAGREVVPAGRKSCDGV